MKLVLLGKIWREGLTAYTTNQSTKELSSLQTWVMLKDKNSKIIFQAIWVYLLMSVLLALLNIGLNSNNKVRRYGLYSQNIRKMSFFCLKSPCSLQLWWPISRSINFDEHHIGCHNCNHRFCSSQFLWPILWARTRTHNICSRSYDDKW